MVQVSRSLHAGVTHVIVDPGDVARHDLIKKRVRYESLFCSASSWHGIVDHPSETAVQQQAAVVGLGLQVV